MCADFFTPSINGEVCQDSRVLFRFLKLSLAPLAQSPDLGLSAPPSGLITGALTVVKPAARPVNGCFLPVVAPPPPADSYQRLSMKQMEGRTVELSPGAQTVLHRLSIVYSRRQLQAVNQAVKQPSKPVTSVVSGGNDC